MGAVLAVPLVFALASAAASADPAASSSGTIIRERFLGAGYPLDVVAAYHVGLFHWVDSLAGTSGGKTVPAHRREYLQRFGTLSGRDTEILEAFREAREADAVAPRPGAAAGVRGLAHLRAWFFGAPDLDTALLGLDSVMETEDAAKVRRALRHFDLRYRTIWRDAGVIRAFLDRAEEDPGRSRLGRILRSVAEFFGVDPRRLPRPALVLVPVPSGYGTHAVAVDRYLLLEVRPGDRLADQAAVIVHENAHYLFHNVPAARLRSFLEQAQRRGRGGMRAWALLQEAIPTALGQGYTDRRFRPRRWSLHARWYHQEDVDALAKKIYPKIEGALEEGRTLDRDFLDALLAQAP